MPLTATFGGFPWWVPVASLAWFVIGVLCGRLLPKAAPRSARREKAPRRGSRSGRSSRNAPELYVGNLSYDVTDADLQRVFGEHGRVASVRVIKNRFNDKSKGYAFVRMADEDQNQKAMKTLNGKEYKGRKMVVNTAKNKTR